MYNSVPAPQTMSLHIECLTLSSLLLLLRVSIPLPYFYVSLSLLNYFLSLTTDIPEKQPGDDCPSKPIQSTGSSQSPVFSSETSSSSSQSLLSSAPTSSEQPSTEEPSPMFPSSREGKMEHAASPRLVLNLSWVLSTSVKQRHDKLLQLLRENFGLICISITN